MRLPTLHTNGTSATGLLEGYLIAYRAVGDAIDALQKAGPNGRDYYPQGPGAINEAVVEHRERLLAMARVQSDLMELCEACNP